MPGFLTFHLVAPMASFGAIAVGERRPGWDRPARSAVLGLIGACLGVKRDDEPGQQALASDYHLALLCHAPGLLLADYHTAQMPSAKRGRRFATRAQELAAPDLNTVLSRRDYRTGAWHLGAVWPKTEHPRWSLDQLAAAMSRPVFVPSLGRKSCPLGLPLAPRIADAADPVAALTDRHAAAPSDIMVLRATLATHPAPLTVTLDADLIDPDTAPMVQSRRDQPLSRMRWQFDLRREAVLPAVSRT